MSIVTRSKSAARLRDVVLRLPDCLWLEILGHLPGRDIGRLSAVCKLFRDMAPDVWQEACAKRWPEWYALSAAPRGSHWRRHYEMFELRQNDLEVVGSPPTINKLQTVVTAVHRTVLAEWLTEVSCCYTRSCRPKRQVQCATAMCASAGFLHMGSGLDAFVQGHQLPGSLSEQTQRGTSGQVSRQNFIISS